MSWNGGVYASHGGYAFEDGECVVSVDFGLGQAYYKANKWLNLPCYPEEVQEQVSATWAEQSILGRTGSLVAYTGASDVSYSFSFDLHRDHPYMGKSDPTGSSIDQIISLIKSGIYPKYDLNMLRPPITTFKFGDIWIDGRLMSVSTTWKKPIIQKKPAICTVSVQITSVARSILGYDEIVNYNPRRHPTWMAKADTEVVTNSSSNGSSLIVGTGFRAHSYDQS